MRTEIKVEIQENFLLAEAWEVVTCWNRGLQAVSLKKGSQVGRWLSKLKVALQNWDMENEVWVGDTESTTLAKERDDGCKGNAGNA